MSQAASLFSLAHLATVDTSATRKDSDGVAGQFVGDSAEITSARESAYAAAREYARDRTHDKWLVYRDASQAWLALLDQRRTTCN